MVVHSCRDVRMILLLVVRESSCSWSSQSGISQFFPPDSVDLPFLLRPTVDFITSLEPFDQFRRI
jgi:hypothetical protein